MSHRCSHCGFRASEAGFFRREEGGLLNTPKSVCEACSPFCPDKSQRRNQLTFLLLPFAWAWFGAVKSADIYLEHGAIKSHREDAWLYALILFSVAMVNLPLHITLHEAAHAFTARLVGATVLKARIAGGSALCRLRVAGIPFEFGSYFYAGGLTEFLPITGRFTRLRKIAVVVAGPLCNMAVATAAVGTAVSLHGHRSLVVPIGWTCFMVAWLNVRLTVTNLFPSKTKAVNREVATDGQQILSLLKCKADDASVAAEQLYTVLGLGRLKRHAEALEEGLSIWRASPNRLYLAALVMNAISILQGETAAIEFYLANAAKLTTPENSDIHGKVSYPVMKATVAWLAANSGDERFAPLAAQMAADVRESDMPTIRSGYAVWLLSVGRVEEALPILTTAIRACDELWNKAAFCAVLAKGWRQQGNAEWANLYDRLGAYYGTMP